MRFRLHTAPPSFADTESLHRIVIATQAMSAAWEQAIGNSDIWQQRIDGTVYRRTPLVGRYRWYRRLRVWWLRRQL